jgi:transcriptional regulator with XRE-family HTH domain
MIRLRYERLRRKLTLQELGYKAKVQASEISKFERGLLLPYPGQRKRLARAIGCAPEELLEEVGDADTAATAAR